MISNVSLSKNYLVCKIYSDLTLKKTKYWNLNGLILLFRQTDVRCQFNLTLSKMNEYIDITKEQIFALLKGNETDRIKAEEIRKSRDKNYNPYPNGWNRHDFFKEVFSDMYIDGFIMTYPHGTVVRQAQRSYFYRGENQLFDSSQASLYRRLNKIKNSEELMIEEFVAYMKIADFLELLLKLDHTQVFIQSQYSFNNAPAKISIDLLYEQLAQHYGLETYWLDITTDFEVALFFACCKFDNQSHKWRPLNKEDFNESYKTLFGVIFQSPTNLPSHYLPEELKSIRILPVGFQPFMRCHMQNSYVASIEKSHCLQKENTFKKLRFKHDEELCNYIFNKMDFGKKIYPHEGLNLMEAEIEKIKKRKIFSIETFEFVCEEPKFKSLNKDTLKQLLMDFGYELKDTQNLIPEEKIEQINKLYSNFDMEQTYKIKFRTRLTVSK